MTLEFLLTEAFPFIVSVVVLALIGVFQIIGLSTDLIDLDWLDSDHDGHADNDLLSWLGVGTLPLSVVLVVMLSTFSAAGIAIQSFFSFPYLIAVPLATVGAFVATGFLAPILARIWPKDETTAISRDQLLGKRGIIVSGIAGKGNPAQVKVYDVYGQPHYVMMEPTGVDPIPEGAEVLLVSRVGNTFRGLDPTGGFRPVEEEGHV